MKKWSAVLALTLTMLFMLISSTFAEQKDNYCIAQTVEATGNETAKDITVNPGDYIKVTLYAAGGTGYSWELNTNDIVNEVSRSATPADDRHLCGGPVRYEFVLQIKAEASQPETLHFALVRPWEKKEQPAKVFDVNLALE